MKNIKETESFILITKTYNNVDIIPPFYIAVDESVAAKIKSKDLDIRYVNDRGDDTACALIVHKANGKTLEPGNRSFAKLVTGRRYTRRKKVHGKNWRNFTLSNYKPVITPQMSQFATLLIGRSNMKSIAAIDKDIKQLENKIKLLTELKQLNSEISALE